MGPVSYSFVSMSEFSHCYSGEYLWVSVAGVHVILQYINWKDMEIRGFLSADEVGLKLLVHG